VLSVLGSVSGAVALIYQMSALALAIGIFITGLFFGYLKLHSTTEIDILAEFEDQNKKVVEELPTSKAGVMLYLAIVAYAFYLLYQSKSAAILSTPWQTISPQFILVFFIATLILGLLTFSRLKAGTILFLLFIHSLLLHTYLPLSHELFYGADGWRHLATQASWWQQGTIISPSLSTVPVGFWQRLDLGSLAYAQFNAISLLFQKLCQVDPILFIKYFLPVVWSIVLPIILFELVRAYDLKKRTALFLVWFAAWPFALQVSGSFSLPINLGILFWLLSLWLMIKNNKKPTDSGRVFLIILGILFIFTHTVFFVLYWTAFVLINLLKINFSKVSLLLIGIAVAAVMPAIELVSNFSNLNHGINWWAQIKTLLGSFSGWYLAFGLRARNVGVGNIFFNQPSLDSFIPNLFTVWRGWIVVMMIIFLVVWLLGIRKMLQANSRLNNFWVIFSIGVLTSYVVSRYFLSGDNIFARRLDATLAVLIILPVVYLGHEFLKNKVVIFLTVFIFSAAIAASYTLGPDTRVVSGAEYDAMQYIWNREAGNKKICVLADTYPLLALEQISARRVVGGGFPINSSFAQPERINLLNVSYANPSLAVSQAKGWAGTENCYLVGDYQTLWPSKQFGNIKVYNF
ncbi:MAG: hypothetical protein NT034_01665, partial [Candidatus Magasanikbacteria bacterium]|nr:hypothetical protein [Candidatus Magasanikbacteria bacterium]